MNSRSVISAKAPVSNWIVERQAPISDADSLAGSAVHDVKSGTTRSPRKIAHRCFTTTLLRLPTLSVKEYEPPIDMNTMPTTPTSLLKATRGVTIALVSSRQRKRRQPGLATDDPAFVRWHQLVRGIQGS